MSKTMLSVTRAWLPVRLRNSASSFGNRWVSQANVSRCLSDSAGAVNSFRKQPLVWRSLVKTPASWASAQRSALHRYACPSPSPSPPRLPASALQLASSSVHRRSLSSAIHPKLHLFTSTIGDKCAPFVFLVLTLSSQSLFFCDLRNSQREVRKVICRLC